MRKILMIALLMSALFAKGFSQEAMPTPVVGLITDAAQSVPTGMLVSDAGVKAAATTANSISTITQTINKIMAVNQLQLLDRSLFDNISTAMEILEYIDQIACQTSELKYNYRFLKDFSCLTMLNMKAVTMNINYSSQIINKLFNAADIVTMTKEGRIKALNDVLAILKQTSNALGDQNIIIRGYLSRKIAQDYLNNSSFQQKTHSVGDRYR